MKFTYSGLFLGSSMLAMGFVACSGGGETTASTTTGSGGEKSSSAATTSTGGSGGGSATTTATATSTAAGTGGGGATASSSSTGMPAVGYCTKPCGTVAECCPVGSVNCPSNMYPDNYTCDKSACKSPQCATTADCIAQDPKQDCLALSGFKTCSTTCAADGDCLAPTTCSGVDDNGKKYCLASGGGCASDAACNGFGKCVNKVCVCEKASDCTKPGFTACAL